MCRLQSVSTVLANRDLDDPLENAEQLADQMESLPFIFRFEYEDMNMYFCSLMDPIVTAYSRGLAPGVLNLTRPCFDLTIGRGEGSSPEFLAYEASEVNQDQLTRTQAFNSK